MRNTPTLFSVVAVVALASCSSTTTTVDRAGGAGADNVRTLTMAQPTSTTDAALQTWATEVEKKSGGRLRIEFETGWRSGEPDYEQGTITDVRNGKVDLAWVGARAFDKAGVTRFDPLIAPLLVDSYALQRAVFDADIPDRMLESLVDIDLVGIGVLPGPMRRMLGTSRAFRTADDFRGAKVGIQESGVAERTMAMLGATASPIASGGSIDGLDGVEQQLGAIAGNRYSADGGSVTGNLDFWPRPLVLFTKPGRIPDTDLAILRSAIAESLAPAFETAADDDKRAVDNLCTTGTVVVSATEADLEGLRRAVAPLYQDLALDPKTGTDFRAIQALKAATAAPPDSVSCPDAVGSTTGAPAPATTADPAGAFPQGTFTTSWDPGPISAACGGEQGKQPGRVEITFENGSIRMFHFTPNREADFIGTYEVFHDQLTMTDVDGPITMGWSFDGTNLRFTDFTEDCLKIAFGGRSWVRKAG